MCRRSGSRAPPKKVLLGGTKAAWPHVCRRDELNGTTDSVLERTGASKMSYVYDQLARPRPKNVRGAVRARYLRCARADETRSRRVREPLPLRDARAQVRVPLRVQRQHSVPVHVRRGRGRGCAEAPRAFRLSGGDPRPIRAPAAPFAAPCPPRVLRVSRDGPHVVRERVPVFRWACLASSRRRRSRSR